jgi:dTDP-4-amino-4,6-dideoxygalactose transaminase
MKKIQMVDLKVNILKFCSVNDAIQEVLDTNTYINGPEVHQFQKRLKSI